MSTNPCLEVVVRNREKIRRNVLLYIQRKGFEWKEIYVYKSRVAGTCKPNSDIDIYVQLDEKHRAFIEEHGNVWGGKKGVGWGQEAIDMNLAIIEGLVLDVRMGLEPTPHSAPKYEGKKYYMKLSEVC